MFKTLCVFESGLQGARDDMIKDLMNYVNISDTAMLIHSRDSSQNTESKVWGLFSEQHINFDCDCDPE